MRKLIGPVVSVHRPVLFLSDIWRQTEVIKTIRRKATGTAETSLEKVKGYIRIKFIVYCV